MLVGSGYRWGWLLYACASGINAYIGFHAGYFGMAVGGLCYFALEIRGWWKHNHPVRDESSVETSSIS